MLAKYHVPDIPRAIRELRRVPAPGGVALVSTNGGRGKAGIAQVCRRAERLVRDEIDAKGAFEVTSRCGLLVCSG